MFGSALKLTLETMYEPGLKYEVNTHLDMFMALFMICTIEVLLLKVLLFHEELRGPHEEYESSTFSSSSAAQELVTSEHI